PRLPARGRSPRRRSTARTRRAGSGTAGWRRRCRSTATAAAAGSAPARRGAARPGSCPARRRGSRRPRLPALPRACAAVPFPCAVQDRRLDLRLPRRAGCQPRRPGEQPPAGERARRVDLGLPAEVVALVSESDPVAIRPPVPGTRLAHVVVDLEYVGEVGGEQ